MPNTHLVCLGYGREPSQEARFLCSIFFGRRPQRLDLTHRTKALTWTRINRSMPPTMMHAAAIAGRWLPRRLAATAAASPAAGPISMASIWWSACRNMWSAWRSSVMSWLCMSHPSTISMFFGFCGTQERAIQAVYGYMCCRLPFSRTLLWNRVQLAFAAVQHVRARQDIRFRDH